MLDEGNLEYESDDVRSGERLVKWRKGVCEMHRFSCYLGSIMDNSGGFKVEMWQRIQLTKSTVGPLRTVRVDSTVIKELKVRLVNALVFSFFLYASET